MEMGRELSLENKLRQRSVRDRVDQVLEGQTPGPWVVELDPTTACNLACHDCISANLLNQGGFDRERIRDLAQEFIDIGVRAVVLIGGGEPMAHPAFGTIVDMFHDAGLHLGLTSNGTLVHKHLERLAEKFKWVRISVDAGTNETFREFRPTATGASLFTRVIDNMRALAPIRTGKLGYSFLVLSKTDAEGNEVVSNVGDIEAAAHLAKDIGCDYFEVKPSFDMMHFLQTHAQSVNDVVRQQMERIAHLQSETFRMISPYTLHEALQGHDVQAKPYTRCLTARLRTVVSPSGVYVCPYHRGNADLRIGDAKTTSFQDIWNGEQRRETMAKLDPSTHCGFHCIRHRGNMLLEQWAAKGPNGRDSVDDYDLFI